MHQQKAKPVCTKGLLAAGNKPFKFSRDMVRELCLDAGADAAGFVDIAQEGLASEREGILRVYPATRGIIALVRVMNRENLQSPARDPANDEAHCVGDEFSQICRDILRRLNEQGIRGVVGPKILSHGYEPLARKDLDVSHKTLAVAVAWDTWGSIVWSCTRSTGTISN